MAYLVRLLQLATTAGTASASRVPQMQHLVYKAVM